MKVLLCFTFLYSFFVLCQYDSETAISYKNWSQLSPKFETSRGGGKDKSSISDNNKSNCEIKNERYLRFPPCVESYEYATHPVKEIIKSRFDVPEYLKAWEIDQQILSKGRTQFELTINDGDWMSVLSLRFTFESKWTIETKNCKNDHKWEKLKIEKKITESMILFKIINNHGESPKIQIDGQEIAITGFEEEKDLILYTKRPIKFSFKKENARFFQEPIKLYSDEVSERTTDVSNSTHWNKNKCLFVSAYSSYEGQSRFSPLKMPKIHSKKLQKEMANWGFDTVAPIISLDRTNIFSDLKNRFKSKSKDFDIVLVHIGGHGVVNQSIHYLVPTQCNKIDDDFMDKYAAYFEEDKTIKSTNKNEVKSKYREEMKDKYIKSEDIFNFIRGQFNKETLIVFIIDACRSDLSLPKEIRGETTSNQTSYEIPTWDKSNSGKNSNAVLCYVTENGQTADDDGYTTDFLNKLESVRKKEKQSSVIFDNLFLWSQKEAYANLYPKTMRGMCGSFCFGKKIQEHIKNYK